MNNQWYLICGAFLLMMVVTQIRGQRNSGVEPVVNKALSHSSWGCIAFAVLWWAYLDVHALGMFMDTGAPASISTVIGLLFLLLSFLLDYLSIKYPKDSE